MAIDITGSGNLMDSSRIGRFESHTVSPVDVSFNPTAATISPVNAGLGIEAAQMVMNFNGKASDSTITTIDDYVTSSGLEKLDFIKMDIEGAERGALQGAVNTIKIMRPKLSISVYHHPDDIRVIFKIIHYIYGNNCAYYIKNVTNTYF